MDNNTLKDKYVHATAWDWSANGSPGLRAALEREWESAHTGAPAGMDADEFRRRSRAVVHAFLKGLADRHLLGYDPDLYYKALFPFPDHPCAGDMLIMDALRSWIRP